MNPVLILLQRWTMKNHRTEDKTYLSISKAVQHSNQEALRGWGFKIVVNVDLEQIH